jgi:hypothetical protein
LLNRGKRTALHFEGCALLAGRTIWIVDAHRGDGRRFVVRADEKLASYPEVESAMRSCGELPLLRHF